MIGSSDFDGLVIFTRIAQAGSLAAAERATGIPKATLSRRLATLEQSLEVRLVRRTKTGVVLTEEGRRLFERGLPAVGLAELAVAEVRHDGTALSGNVRLSLPPDIAVAALGPALIRFKRRHPDVNVEMTLADRRVSLVEEGYDLVVRMGPLTDSDLMSRRIASLPRTLVASPAFVNSYPEMLEPSKLAKLPALAITRDASPWELTGRDSETALVRPRVGFAANRQTILVDAAIADLGIANLPTFLVQDELLTGRLVRVLPDWEASPVEMTALWQKDRITGRLVAAIVSEFVEAFHETSCGLRTQ